MENVVISKIQARTFAATLCIAEILNYADNNKANYEQFLSLERQSVSPKKKQKLKRDTPSK